jgi:single-strand DNA-binding protein
MANLRNRVQLIGNLGTDPEIVKFENGRKLSRFSLATTDIHYDNNGEKKEDTQWHNVVGWGNLAEISEKYLKKGSGIAVDGKIVYRSYANKDGQKKYITEIVMDELFMLPRKDA